MDRKAELEKKRKKLEELRRAREAKQLAGRNLAAASTTDGERDDRQVSELVTSLLGEPLPSLSGPAKGSSSGLTTPTLASGGGSAIDLSTSANVLPSSRPVVTLTTTQLPGVAIPPQVVVVYEKGAQTDDWMLEEAVKEKLSGQSEALAVQESGDQMEEDEETDQEQKEEFSQQDEVCIEKVTQLEEEQAQLVMESTDFQDFFVRSSRIIERALDEPYDVAIDYTGRDEEPEGVEEAGREVELLHTYSKEELTMFRASSSLDWSPKYPELFLSSYTQNERISSEPSGSVLVWNMHLKDRPEFVFHCQQSPVLSAVFAPFTPHLIVGGTYSGQVVLWDRRAKSAPVQRTSLSTKAHAHPIYNMQVVGTQNAHNLITVSNDGRLCSWLLDMLLEPQDTIDIREVAPMAVTFPDNDVNNFIVGAEDGVVHLGSRLSSNSGTVQAQPLPKLHKGPVTSVSCHPAVGETDFSDYVLSSSTDWSIKLWSRAGQKIVHSFDESSDYVYDVQWSPTHPALFASVDGAARLCVWNINENAEAPIATAQVNKNGVPGSHLRWSSDGRRIIVGDAEGNVSLFNVGELLTAPKSDAWSRLRDTAKELLAAQVTPAQQFDNYRYSSVYGQLHGLTVRP